MKSFFYNNQTAISIVGVVLFLVILYFVIKSLPTKALKKQVSKSKSAEEVKDKEVVETKEETLSTEEIKAEETEEKTQEEIKKDKKSDKKPKIVQIYKRERKEETSGENKKFYDPIYDRSVEFVNTSKNIAKFKSFAEDVKEDEVLQVKDEFGFVEDVKEDCEFCETKTKHFDHSRRLSKCINDDNFDDLFESHLSEKYMNINSSRHLNLNDDFDKKLFERTERMMKNSDGKCKCEELGVQENQRFSLFSDNSIVEDDDAIEEDIPINMKTALLSEVYLGRKLKRK